MGSAPPPVRDVGDAPPPPGGLPEDQDLSEQSRTVAAFDLDGTLTRRDTLLPFLLRAFGPERTGRALLARSLSLALGLAGGSRRDAAKRALLEHLLAGQPLERLQALAEDFADEVVARRLRPEVRKRMEWHRDSGHELVIVSASPELYVSPIGRRLGADAVLATRLEVGPDGRLTGRLLGRNCRGPEKVARLREWLGSEPVSIAWAYGDSRGDRELLAVAATPVRVGGRRFRS
jgi:phosphatidylglycerophosphatase C